MTWTSHMLIAQPESWEHWLAYFGAVAGWSSARYYMKKKQPAADDAPEETPPKDPKDPP